jgi:hypothetical protein
MAAPRQSAFLITLREEEMATTQTDVHTARNIFFVVAVLMAIGLGLLLFPQAMFTLRRLVIDPGGDRTSLTFG